MKFQPIVLNYIKEKEGLRLNAYKCPAGVWTIGYGNTFLKKDIRVKEGDVLPNEEAASKLFEDSLINEYLPQTNKLLLGKNAYKLGSYQISSLVSYVYNRGIGNARKDLKPALDAFLRQPAELVHRQLCLVRQWYYLAGIEMNLIPEWVKQEVKLLIDIRNAFLKPSGYTIKGQVFQSLLDRRREEFAFFCTPDNFIIYNK